MEGGGGHAPPRSARLRGPPPPFSRATSTSARCARRQFRWNAPLSLRYGALSRAQRLALCARTTAAPWRVEGSLCRCSLQSAGQHSSPNGYLVKARPARTSAASATPPQRTIEPLRFRRPAPRLHLERTARPRGPAHEASPKDRRASVQLFTRPSLAGSLGRA